MNAIEKLMNDRTDSLAKLRAKHAEETAKFERELALAVKLPTHGRTFTWIGDGGYKGNDKQPDVEKTVELAPWLFHGHVFRGCQHVAYKAPYDYPDYGPLAAAMKRRYIDAVIEAFAPYRVDILAIKGKYASNVPVTFDWFSSRDYSDASQVAKGQAEIEMTQGVAPYFSNAKIEFYADIPGAGPVQVSLELPASHRITPRPQGVHRYGSDGPVHRVDNWILPAHKAVNVWRHRGEQGTSFTAEYLYESPAVALADYFGED